MFQLILRPELGLDRDEVVLPLSLDAVPREEEERQALGAGWQLVTLGDSILRTSTAAVAGLAALALLRPAAAECSQEQHPLQNNPSRS